MHILFRLLGQPVKVVVILTRIGEKISLIDTEALGKARVVAAYLIAGKENALIDMGYRSSADVVKRDLIEAGIESDDLDYLMPTHVHLDHCGSCGTLAKHFPSSLVLVHPIGAKHLADPSHLLKRTRELFGDELMRKYGDLEPTNSRRIRSIADDETISLGEGLTLRSIWTPGHASHHVSYLLEGMSTVFTGDSVGVHYPDFPVLVPTTPPPRFELEQAIGSIHRIRNLAPTTLCTPHFGLLQGTKDWFDRNIQALMEWKATFESWIRSGRTVEEMARSLLGTIAEKGGRRVSDLPEQVKVSVRIDVLGFVRYLQFQVNR